MTTRRLAGGAGRLAIAMLVLALLQLASTQGAEARPRIVTPHIFPPGSVPYGHTYGEWSAISWQAIFGTVWDPTACALGAVGQVLLLQATAGGPGVFECDVPAGAAFLVRAYSAYRHALELTGSDVRLLDRVAGLTAAIAAAEERLGRNRGSSGNASGEADLLPGPG